MPAKKKSTKTKVKVEKIVEPKKTPDIKEGPKKRNSEVLIDKRNSLIMGIKSKLLTKSRLKRGGSDVRRLHQHELSSYEGVLIEINNIGKELGLAPIGLGQLRKE